MGIIPGKTYIVNRKYEIFTIFLQKKLCKKRCACK